MIDAETELRMMGVNDAKLKLGARRLELKERERRIKEWEASRGG